MKNFLRFFLAVVIFFQISQAKAEVTLQESLRQAYENNPELKAQGYSLEASKSQRLKAYGGFLPKASFDFNDGSQKNQIGSGSDRIHGDIYKKVFTVSQDLFNGGGTFFDIKRANSEVDKQKASRDAKEQEIFLNVIVYYLNVLRYEELLKISQSNLDSQATLLEHTKKKTALRDATKSELAKAEADYISALNGKSSTQDDLSSAKASFSKLTGMPIADIKNLKPINDGFSGQKIDDLNADQLIELAFGKNPQLKAVKHEMESARHQSSISKSNLSPSIKFNASTSEEKNSVYLGNRTQKNDSVYLSLHVPLFNSGIEYAQISEANNVLKSKKYDFDAARDKIKQQIIEQVNKIKSLHTKYQAAKEQESANKIYVAALKEEERLGTKSIIDLLKAKQDFFSAQLSRANLYYDKMLAVFELKTLTGNLVYETINSNDILEDFSSESKNLEATKIEVHHKTETEIVAKDIKFEAKKEEDEKPEAILQNSLKTTDVDLPQVSEQKHEKKEIEKDYIADSLGQEKLSKVETIEKKETLKEMADKKQEKELIDRMSPSRMKYKLISR